MAMHHALVVCFCALVVMGASTVLDNYLPIVKSAMISLACNQTIETPYARAPNIFDASAFAYAGSLPAETLYHVPNTSDKSVLVYACPLPVETLYHRVILSPSTTPPFNSVLSYVKSTARLCLCPPLNHTFLKPRLLLYHILAEVNRVVSYHASRPIFPLKDGIFLSIYYHFNALYRLIIFMHYMPRRSYRILARLVSLRLSRNMLSRNDYLVLVQKTWTRKMPCSQLEKLIRKAGDHNNRIGIMYTFCNESSNTFSLSWFFLVLELYNFATQYRYVPNTRRKTAAIACRHCSAQRLTSLGVYKDNEYAHSNVRGGGRPHEFSFETLARYIILGPPVGRGNAFKFMDHVRNTDQEAYPITKNFVHVRMPLNQLIPHLPLKVIFRIANLHGIQFGSHVPKSEVVAHFNSHECALCDQYTTIFTIVDSKVERERVRKHSNKPQNHQGQSERYKNVSATTLIHAKNNFHADKAEAQEAQAGAVDLQLSRRPDDTSSKPSSLESQRISPNNELRASITVPITGEDIKQSSSISNMQGCTDITQDSSAGDAVVSSLFPPSPVDRPLSCEIMRRFCSESTPAKFQEAGCAVCGQLTPTTQLTRLKTVKNLLHVLQASDVTSVERKKASDPVREFKGPVLDYKCDRICDCCRKHIRKNQIPPRALANGLWLGAVPEELASLRFVEKLLVARVRVNNCFIRVASSGLRKMASHVIAFESPIPKVYQKLPPPVEDLDEVLAILFTGPCRPTEKEFQRTPLLVRRNYVARALEWLKLNHVDYADLEISYDDLEKYPEDSPPVSVEYRHSETNKVAEGTSVFDNATDDGITDGECPFLVHGLSGSQVATKSVEELKAIALRHWNNRGGALAISHDANAVSIYNNPNLYPQLFPWLFPYGLGGIGSTKLSDKLHKRHLLLYHDKRFQRDIAFPFVAFSHEQIKASASAGFLLAETSKFNNIADRLLNVNQDILADVSRRMSEGETVKPASEDENACFQLIRDLDHMNGKVNGSVTSKKYMRSEIWSLMIYLGAPLWYITLSPADNKHPLCLYFADNKEKFDVTLTRSADDRYRLIANNPVASARFFHFMIQSFIKHVLGVDADHRGLYGKTSAYYGTVEQQGRLTLHLHMLLWIQGCLSPDEIHCRIRDPDSDFRRSIIDYLESAHAGEFLTGTMEQVEAAVDRASQAADYRNPTETLPDSPPPPCQLSECDRCEHCASLTSWWATFKEIVDDLILKSNIHRCSSNMNKDGSQNRARAFKGCLDNIWGKCKARFPRATFDETDVDSETGAINMKKREPWINTFTYVVTYLFRCNTDVTSLRSGTALKGVILYITNYVTKSPLKTHVIFDTVRSIFLKSPDMIGGSASRQEKARKLMTRIVNSLSAKMEMGSPMICMYLLGNPDHYTNHHFRPFYWQSFVRETQKPWVHIEPSNSDVDNYVVPEKVAICRRNGRIIGFSPVHDYIFRPDEIGSMSLYDWISRCEREKKPTGRKGSRGRLYQAMESDVESTSDDEGKIQQHNTTSLLSFLAGHPLADSHGTRCRSPLKARVPNFVGATLPRFDQGDREYYCCTMLTLFKPWRSGLDLKLKDETWDDAFSTHQFSQRQREIMKNMNIRYECLDAQDDFHSQMKKGTMTMVPGWDDGGDRLLEESAQIADEDCITWQQDDPLTIYEETVSPAIGKRELARRVLMTNTRRILQGLGWMETRPDTLPDGVNRRPSSCRPPVHQPPSLWKAVVASKRAQILEERARHIPSATVVNRQPANFKPNDVHVVDKSYMTNSFRSKEWQLTMDDVAKRFSLNKEQERAFRIVANHACSPDADQLKMYIGGMAGTGKSQVLKALTEFFRLRNECHRLIVVAPTGSAAALLGGSTYHFMFGINNTMEDSQTTNMQLAQIKSRLRGVEYVFLDEVSMLSCRDLYLISERLARIMNNLETPFGRMNMIFAGDFAQLPPVIGQEHASLYSRTVGRRPTSLRDQEAAIGKALWHQMTTIVILRENMRQRTESPEDTKFRQALENMRYKACTQADITFLKSRISSNLPDRPSVNDKNFRNVSIITALNSVKDEINHLGCQRFAAETGQKLSHFYSMDTRPSEESETVKRREGRRRRRKKRTIEQIKIPENIQHLLWEQPCCGNTKLIPAKLSLCPGMPVMLRNNTATEMCITKGQEAIVHSWESIKNAHGKSVLETLFVELVNPPTPVVLEGLPVNVIPLTRTSVITSCQLPDDTTLTLSRNQIEIHINFAMTDYASQGKTRPYNVVDLSYSRSHQGYYTALSRSASAAGTLILTSFHSSKITGGASHALRQEFRELELLDTITTLKFEGKLPRKIAMVDRRNPLIAAFREYKGMNYMPSKMHKAIRWSKTDKFLEWEGSVNDWCVIDKKAIRRLTDYRVNSSVSHAQAEAAQIHDSSTTSPKTIACSLNTYKHSSQKTPVNCTRYPSHSPLQKEKKRKISRSFTGPIQPIKKLKLQQVSSDSVELEHVRPDVLIPLGTQWQNNSCAYDAVFTILFNVWREDPDSIDLSWREIQSNLLNYLHYATENK